MNGTITLSEKGQAVFPLQWRKQHGLAGGGEGRCATAEEALICYPIKPMTESEAEGFVAKAGRPVNPPPRLAGAAGGRNQGLPCGA